MGFNGLISLILVFDLLSSSPYPISNKKHKKANSKHHELQDI